MASERHRHFAQVSSVRVSDRWCKEYRLWLSTVTMQAFRMFRSALKVCPAAVTGPRLFSTAPPVLKNYIDGKYVESVSGETLDVVNPATQEVLA